MREIKYYNHTDGLYITTHYCFSDDLEKLISNWKHQVRNDCITKNADHYIYMTKIYDAKTDEIIEVNLYATPLSREEFEKRTKEALITAKAKDQDIYFGVWHKGTSY